MLRKHPIKIWKQTYCPLPIWTKNVPYNTTSNSNNTSLIITRENNRAGLNVGAYEIITAFNNICVSLSPYPKLLDKDKNNLSEMIKTAFRLSYAISSGRAK